MTQDRLMVNAKSDVVHWLSCPYAQRAVEWLTSWDQPGRVDEDRACQSCLPDGLPVPTPKV